MTIPLSGKQQKYLRGLAHGLSPVVLIGTRGVAEEQIRTIEDALLAHELIKVRFLDYKEEKRELARVIAEKTGSVLAGIVGHVAIFYRPHPDQKKRRIVLERDGGVGA